MHREETARRDEGITCIQDMKKLSMPTDQNVLQTGPPLPLHTFFLGTLSPLPLPAPTPTIPSPWGAATFPLWLACLRTGSITSDGNGSSARERSMVVGQQ